MRKRGERLMETGFGVILSIAALALLAIAGYRLFFSRTEIQRQENSSMTSRRPTNKDRELLDLIGDLAELYRATGR